MLHGFSFCFGGWAVKGSAIITAQEVLAFLVFLLANTLIIDISFLAVDVVAGGGGGGGRGVGGGGRRGRRRRRTWKKKKKKWKILKPANVVTYGDIGEKVEI